MSRRSVKTEKKISKNPSSSLRNWEALKPGDRVDVIAPGFGTDQQTVQEALQVLRRWGLVPRVPADLLGDHYLFSNKENRRWKHLQKALEASDSQAIWCLRGGYGSIRLLPYLEKMVAPKRVKLFMGLSDITSLHVFLNQRWGWPTLHGPVLDRLAKSRLPPAIEDHLRDLVFGVKKQTLFNKLRPLNKRARAVKKMKGFVIGGNLTVLQSTLGTNFQIRTEGALLFIEDLGERGYRVDRILEQFRQAGLFENCRGLLVGHFIGDQEPGNQPGKTKQVLQDWADQLKIPVFSEIEAGHDEWQWPLPLNTPCEIIQRKSFELELQTGVKA